MLFACVCLFFNSSLFIDSYIFTILLSRYLIIFTIIILNSFSGSLPICSSFIWTSVFLVCCFVCAVFLCLFIIFLNLLFEVSFSQTSRKVEFFPWRRLNSFFLLVSALLGWSSGLYRLCIGWDLCSVFVCLFFLWWSRLSEMVIPSADDWICIFVFFVVEM